MAILTTGPVNNGLSGAGVRSTTSVTVQIANRDQVNSSSVLIEGYYLNGSRNLYVQQLVNIPANGFVSLSFYANLNAFEFLLTTGGTGASSTEVSVWGTGVFNQLVAAQRIVMHELLQAG